MSDLLKESISLKPLKERDEYSIPVLIVVISWILILYGIFHIFRYWIVSSYLSSISRVSSLQIETGIEAWVGIKMLFYSLVILFAIGLRLKNRVCAIGTLIFLFCDFFLVLTSIISSVSKAMPIDFYWDDILWVIFCIGAFFYLKKML
ncbi:hypothetical protein J7J39_02880 [bacterium]|nr:hypothetical protein [bacterium]